MLQPTNQVQHSFGFHSILGRVSGNPNLPYPNLASAAHQRLQNAVSISASMENTWQQGSAPQWRQVGAHLPVCPYARIHAL